MEKVVFENIVDDVLFKARLADVEISYNYIEVLTSNGTMANVLVSTDSDDYYISVVVNSNGSVDCFGYVDGINLMAHYKYLITKELAYANFSNNAMFVEMNRCGSGYSVTRYTLKGGE